MKHTKGFNSTRLGSTDLRKTLKHAKEFKQRNVSVTARFRKHNCFFLNTLLIYVLISLLIVDYIILPKWL